jgi:hypothetical protein
MPITSSAVDIFSATSNLSKLSSMASPKDDMTPAVTLLQMYALTPRQNRVRNMFLFRCRCLSSLSLILSLSRKTFGYV